MRLRTLSLTAAGIALAAFLAPTPSAQAHDRYWRGDRARVIYRTVPRYRVVHRPRYYSTYAYRPHRYYNDGYYGGWGYRYRPGFALSIGHRGGFIGFGGGGWRW